MNVLMMAVVTKSPYGGLMWGPQTSMDSSLYGQGSYDLNVVGYLYR